VREAGGVSVDAFRVGSVTLTRVGYVDIDLDPAVLGLTPQQVTAVPWAAPTWATAAGQLRVGAAAWVIEDGAERIVVDPAQAADDILRSETDAAVHQAAFAQLLADAGFARDTITHAIASHIDGIGMFAWRNDDGSWSPFFPNAPLLLHERELEAIDRGDHQPSGQVALADLRRAGIVEAVTTERAAVTEHVALEFTGAHSPGHQVVRVTDGDDTAVMLGHLATSAVHLVTGQCDGLHYFPDDAQRALAQQRDEGAVLIGPLWPSPGAGRFEGDRFVALAATSRA
jgi:glyoxylase-like metal-dependent hydrolase (beta-lactamase superfamily II)